MFNSEPNFADRFTDNRSLKSSYRNPMLDPPSFITL